MVSNDELVRQVNAQNAKIQKLNNLHAKMNEQKSQFSIREDALKEEILGLQRKLQNSRSTNKIGGGATGLNN